MITEFDNIKCSVSFFDNIVFNNDELSVEISFVKKETKYYPYVETDIEISRCKVSCSNVVAYLFLQEFPASNADLLKNSQSGSLIFKFNNPSLNEVLGLEILEETQGLESYAIVPQFGDVLVVYTSGELAIEKLA